MKLCMGILILVLSMAFVSCTKKEEPKEEGMQVEGTTTPANDSAAENPTEEMAKKKGSDASE